MTQNETQEGATNLAENSGFRSVSIALSGSGGAGVMTAGNMLLDAAGKAGLYAVMTRTTGPQIRGGEAAAMLRLASHAIEGHDDNFDIFMALDWANVERFAAEIPLAADSLIVADPAAGDVPEVIAASGARIVNLDFKKLAKTIPGGRPNMIALGVLTAVLGLPEEAVMEVIAKTLRKKDEAAVEASRAAIHAGISAASDIGGDWRLPAATETPTQRWTITGNQAAGLGALRGGVRFVAAYPITPATEVLEWMTGALRSSGGVLVQAEDELAAINMAIGASYGGVPALTATSGPGLSLMLESFGLAVASETPVVVIDVMRGGPSTGIPTKSEQSDLNIAVYGPHGDAPHLVVAPTSVTDCLFANQWAVYLAEQLQAPAIVLSDQFLGQARAIIEQPVPVPFVGQREVVREISGEYHRYALTPSGVSPMALPGTAGGQYTADGLEHSPRGTPSSQTDDHLAQSDKRRDKLANFDYGDDWADIEGDGDIAILTWGSTTVAAREARLRAARQGMNVRLVAVRLLSPVQPERLAAALAGVKRILVVEQSHEAQFHRYLRAYYDLPGEVRALARPGPLLFRPGEILEQLTGWC